MRPGQSPREIHQGKRLNETFCRLGDDKRPSKDVARTLGFASADCFSHWLRRTSGHDGTVSVALAATG